MRRFSIATVMLICASTGFAAGAAAPPETLRINDLVNRPDRWPAKTTLTRDIDAGGGKGARKGDQVTIIQFDGQDIGVDCSNDVLVAIGPEDCDILEAANKAWSALTPAQRAVDRTMLIQDASIWPDKVKALDGFDLDNGKSLGPNTEFELLAIKSDGVAVLWYPEFKSRLMLKTDRTDAVSRARERVAMDAEKRPARISEALKRIVVDSDGKPIDEEQLAEAKVFALYYGASWCGPCRSFSPGFVKYIDRVSKDNPHLLTIMMSGDDKEADMFQYMKTEKMPWSAVKKASWFDKVGLMHAYYNGLIPQLVIVDRYGKLLADSYQGTQYVGPARAMSGLDKILKSGAAK